MGTGGYFLGHMLHFVDKLYVNHNIEVVDRGSNHESKVAVDV